MQSYRRYLDETPTSAMTPEAMRRLADLQLEKEFGITGGPPTGRWVEMAAPDAGAAPSEIGAAARRARARRSPTPIAAAESDEDFERRTTGEVEFAPAAAFDLPVPGTEGVAQSGPLEAIAIYERLLAEYPNYERRDQVLYQMARAYDELGRTEEAMDVMQRLVGEFGYSRYNDEVQFRRGEYYFTRRRFREAEGAYEQIVAAGCALGFLRARALQARLVALQARLLRGGAAPLHGAARLQAFGRLRLRSSSTPKRTSAASRTRSASSA